MSHYFPTLLLEGLKQSECEKQNMRSEPPIPFLLPSNWEDSGAEHTVKVKISEYVSETASIFNGGIKESYLIYLKDCQALLHKKKIHDKWKGWNNKRSSAIMDLVSLSSESQESNSSSTKDLVDDPESTDAKKLEKSKITLRSVRRKTR